MGFTNGGGFTQAQPQIVATDFTSSNFSNTNQTGFDLNSGNTTNPDGTPPNTIQIYSGFQVGPTTGTHLDLTYTGGQAQLELFTGLAGEATSASVFAEPYSPTPTIPALVVESAAMTNGFTQLILIPSDNASGGVNDTGRAILGTVGTTVPPSGGNTLKGVLNIGNAAADTWAVVINSENTVASAQPALVVGDTFTPRSRLFVSPSEIKSVDGSGNPETLWLNETNAEASPGPVANILMRHNAATDTAQYTPGTSYTNPTGITLTLTVPASKIITVMLKFCVVGTNGGATASSFIVGSYKVQDTTTASTIISPSDNNSAELDGTWLNATTQITTLTYTIATSLASANVGDTIQVTPQFRQNAASGTGAFQIKKTTLTVIPSL